MKQICSFIKHSGTKGMRWGIRRYQNKDGSLTPEGKKRYAKDIVDNKGKKKDSRIDTSEPNPRRWISEDLKRKQSINEGLQKATKTASDIEQKSSPKKSKKPRADLSAMSNEELKKIIDRETLERRYDDLFNPEVEPEISNGRKYVRKTIEIAGTALALTGSALSIALAINELKGNNNSSN